MFHVTRKPLGFGQNMKICIICERLAVCVILKEWKGLCNKLHPIQKIYKTYVCATMHYHGTRGEVEWKNSTYFGQSTELLRGLGVLDIGGVSLKLPPSPSPSLPSSWCVMEGRWGSCGVV